MFPLLSLSRPTVLSVGGPPLVGLGCPNTVIPFSAKRAVVSFVLLSSALQPSSFDRYAKNAQVQLPRSLLFRALPRPEEGGYETFMLYLSGMHPFGTAPFIRGKGRVSGPRYSP